MDPCLIVSEVICAFPFGSIFLLVLFYAFPYARLTVLKLTENPMGVFTLGISPAKNVSLISTELFPMACFRGSASDTLAWGMYGHVPIGNGDLIMFGKVAPQTRSTFPSSQFLRN